MARKPSHVKVEVPKQKFSHQKGTSYFQLLSLTDARMFFISSLYRYHQKKIYVIRITAWPISLSSANKALLLSNLGRLMRLCAQGVGGVEDKVTGRREEFSQEERSYFNKVFIIVFDVTSSR